MPLIKKTTLTISSMKIMCFKRFTQEKIHYYHLNGEERECTILFLTIGKRKLAFSTFFHQLFFKDAYNDIYLEEEEKDNVKVILMLQIVNMKIMIITRNI